MAASSVPPIRWTTTTRTIRQAVLEGKLGADALIAEVLVGQRVELVLETGREHALDLDLPVLLLEPAVLELGDGVPLETPRDHWSLRDA